MKVWRTVVSILSVILLLLFTACGTELPDSGSSSPLESGASASQQESTPEPESSSSTQEQSSAESSSGGTSAPAGGQGQGGGAGASAAAPSSSSAPAAPEEKQEEPTFTLSISCSTALASGQLQDNIRKVLPADGMLLKAESISFTAGENAFDVFTRECRRRRIAVASTGSYVQSIGGLAEKACGDLSGWMCRVNGVFVDRSLKEYTLQDGDRVEWLYTCNLGKDL